MPARKISRNDVAEAIRVLNQQGIPDPGVHRLRTFLGRGSVTTIARFKNELRQIELERVTPNKAKPLPDPIARLAKRLWDELLTAVEAVETQLATATEQRIAEKQHQLDHIETDRDQALAKVTKLNDKLAVAEKRVEDQHEHIHGLENTLIELKGRLSAHTISLESLSERERQLKRTLAEAAKQSAKRETTLNEQLNQERNRNFEIQRNADRRKQALEEQLQSARDKLSNERERNERMMSSAREKIHLLEQHLKALNHDLETLRTEKAELLDHDEALKKCIRGLEKQQVRSESESKAKDDMIKTLSLRIQELQNLHLEAKNHYERSIKQLETHLSEARKSLPK